MVIGEEVAFVGGIIAACAAVVHGARCGAKWYVVVLRMMAILYAAWVVSVTMLPFGLASPKVERVQGAYLEYSVNLVPFKTILLYLRSDLGQIAVMNLLGNLALLMPYGLFGPVIWPRLDRAWKVFFSAVALSALIEGGQYVRQLVNVDGIGRSVDIDDVILNTAGALLGYAVFSAIRGVSEWVASKRVV